MEKENQSKQPSFVPNGQPSTADQEASNASIMPPSLQFGDGGSTGGAGQTTQLQSAESETTSQNSAGETWDRHTNRRIPGIHPQVQDSAYTFINRAEQELGIKLRVTSGLRTYSEQDELYAKGRTAPGGVVTNARGGQSYHNFGLAIDVVEITNSGEANWNCDWAAIGALGQSIGWEWGGSWSSFVDKPHFQMTFGLSTSDLRAMYNAQGGNFVNLDGRAPVIPETEQDTEQTNEETTDSGTGVVALSGSVGKGGQNLYDDVKLTQSMLNKSGASLAVDGDCGPLTIAAIEAFQMAQFGWKDGRIDVGGKTWKALESTSAPQPVVYTVKSGDNLTKIASQFNVSVAEILSANPSISNPNSISIGQKITIPPKGGTSVPTTPVAENPTTDVPTGDGGNSDPAEGGQTDLIYGSKVTTEFNEKVIQVCSELGINPNYLMAAMAFETGGSFDPAQKNFAGSGATGLIQFMPATARGLGTTTAELAKMSALEQLDYVKAYFLPYAGRISTLEDLYMAILWPRGIGKSNDYVLWSRGTKAYELNSGLDTNNNGSVTKGEAAGKVRVKYEEGMEDIVTVGGTQEQENQSPTNSSGSGESETTEQGGETTTETESTTSGGGTLPSSANFSISEFNCNDGTPVPEEFYANVQELMNNLEVLREELDGNSIQVNSGYRTPAYNESVGGASNSQHKYGKAADIVVANYSPSLVHTTIGRLINEGKMKQGGLGSYNSFTHYDIRGSRARW